MNVLVDECDEGDGLERLSGTHFVGELENRQNSKNEIGIRKKVEESLTIAPKRA